MLVLQRSSMRKSLLWNWANKIIANARIFSLSYPVVPSFISCISTFYWSIKLTIFNFTSKIWTMKIKLHMEKKPNPYLTDKGFLVKHNDVFHYLRKNKYSGWPRDDLLFWDGHFASSNPGLPQTYEKLTFIQLMCLILLFFGLHLLCEFQCIPSICVHFPNPVTHQLLEQFTDSPRTKSVRGGWIVWGGGGYKVQC